MRGVWVTPIVGDWPSSPGLSLSAQKAEVVTILNNMQKNNMNTVFVHMRPYADRLYTRNSYTENGVVVTTYDHTSKYVTTNKSRRGTIETYTENGVTKDILDYWIEEAHKRGIEFYAWLNPYRTHKDYYKTGEGELNWIISATVEDSKGNKVTSYIFDPSNINAQTRIQNTCRVLTHNYDIDGIVFDDYFYLQGQGTDSKADDYSTWQNSGSGLSFKNWRLENTFHIVQTCHDAIHAIKPYVRFAVAPSGTFYKGMTNAEKVALGSINSYTDPTYGITTGSSLYDANDDYLYADPMRWLREKAVDFLSPQLYWPDTHETNKFTPMSAWYSRVANYFGVPILPSLGAYKPWTSNNEAGNIMLNEEVIHHRANNVDHRLGVIFYSSKNVVGPAYTDLGTYLSNNTFTAPSAVPEMSSQKATDPGTVKNLARNWKTLTWDALSSNIRYLVYAIPNTVKESDAIDPVYGGIKGEYLISHVLYNTTTVTLDKEYPSQWWYAVAPLDRYGKEWPYTILGKPAVEAEVSLTSPANAARAAWSQTFTYTGTSGATFKFELAEDATFAKVVKSQNSTATSCTVDFGTLALDKTYYWRVTASKTGYSDKTSETRTVKSPLPEPLNAVTLVSPANGAKAAMSQEFVWDAADPADRYILEISRDANFASANTITTTNTRATVDLSEYDRESTYYWRVRSQKSHCADAVSQVRSFITPETPVLSGPRLWEPRGGITVTGDFCFTAEVVQYATTYVLEVSTDPNFADGKIYLTSTYTKNAVNSSDWRYFESELTSGNYCVQYSVPLNLFDNGTYYWRVRVSTNDSKFKPGCSLTEKFVVGNGNTSSDYIPYRDPQSYDGKETLQFVNLWVRNASNNPLGLDETDTRDMTARGDRNGDQNGLDIVYIVDRNSNVLHRYNGATGQSLSDLRLSFDDNYNTTGGYSLNGILVDDDNNLIVHNLALQAVTNKNLTLGKVNIATGFVTTVFSQNPGHRTDHVSLVGSVDGNYTLFAIGSRENNKNYVCRWKNKGAQQTMLLNDFGPAPRIEAIDSDVFFVDGYQATPQRFKFVNNTTSAQNATATAPSSLSLETLGNGMAHFYHDGQQYMVFANGTDDSPSNGWKIVRDKDFINDFSAPTIYWTFPKDGIGYGKHSSLDHGMPVAVVQRNAMGQITRSASTQTSTVYAYRSGSGLAAYTMATRHTTGVDEVAAEIFKPQFTGHDIDFGCKVDAYAVYDIQGRLLQAGSQCYSAETAIPAGVYIIRAKKDNQILTSRIAIR